MSDEERRSYYADAEAHYERGVAAIEQMTNRNLPSDAIRAGAALAAANFQAAELALKLMEAN